MSANTDQFLTRLPKFTHLLPAIICKGNKQFSEDVPLPDTRYWVNKVELNASQMTAFNQIVNWQQAQFVHPAYLHTLAFGLQIKLMLHKAFPFSVMGVIHIANSIEQLAPLEAGSLVDISCRLGDIRRLKLGWLFCIETDIYRGQQVLIKARHQYLRRATKNSRTAQKKLTFVDWAATDSDEQWELDTSLGWQYAACSDDYNPIHLHPYSARLLGFKQHIAHGMWLKARALSAVLSRHPRLCQQSYKCEVDFKQPLFLPNTALFQQRQYLTADAAAIEFRVSGRQEASAVEHMTGKLICNSEPA